MLLSEDHSVRGIVIHLHERIIVESHGIIIRRRRKRKNSRRERNHLFSQVVYFALNFHLANDSVSNSPQKGTPKNSFILQPLSLHTSPVRRKKGDRRKS